MEWMSQTFQYVDAALCVFCSVVAVLSVFIVRKICKQKEPHPRDVVILHQIGRGPYAPSLTPFAVKLETYFRMAGIPYKNDHGMKRSSKGKFPWIEYNGEAVADSTLCINYLNKKFDINLNSQLRASERSVALAWQVLVEEHMSWCVGLIRWTFINDKSMLIKALKISKLTAWFISRDVKSAGWKQGMRRHSQEEIVQFLKRDLQALEDFIGHGKFLMGHEPCETDCAVFGQLSQIYWQFMGTGYSGMLADKYPNLAAYCERMRTTYWADWDECTTGGGTRQATK